MPERFWNCEQWTMIVSDANRIQLFTLKFFAQSFSLNAACPENFGPENFGLALKNLWARARDVALESPAWR
ncbi:MAG: hypothetical protein WDN24_02030 [Sphingomonas sp.]